MKPITQATAIEQPSTNRSVPKAMLNLILAANTHLPDEIADIEDKLTKLENQKEALLIKKSVLEKILHITKEYSEVEKTFSVKV